ncbi:MAG: SDR family oxidoreductase [Agarilytica sp.]
MTNTVVVTGANRGIGLALCEAYRDRGDDVIALCRQANEALFSLGVKVIDNVDVTHTESIQHAARALAENSIDILVNNAGVLSYEKFGQINFDSVMKQFQVNGLGALRVSEAFAGNMRFGGKIALITSRMGSITDNTSGGYYGYRMSKAALNAGGKSLAIDLKPSGIAVALLHPGFVQTEMVNKAGDISPEEAATRLLERIDELNLENSGTFWHSNGEVLPW